MSSTYGAILAGGLGTRLGGDKAFAVLGRKPLISWVIEALTPQVDCLFIVGGGDRFSAFGLPTVADLPGVEGPVSGALAALGYARTRSASALLIAPCDMPFLPNDLMQRLLCGAQVGVPQVSGRLNWAVSCWPAARFGDVARFGRDASTAQRAPSLRGLFAASDYVEMPQDDIGSFMGINTPEALAAAQAQITPDGDA